MLQKFDWLLVIPIFLLLVFRFFFFYFFFIFFFFFFFFFFDFEIVSAFSKYFYILSILLLVITLIIGQVTRGTVRWIPLGSVSIQPSEIVRPFLLIFFANYIT